MERAEEISEDPLTGVTFVEPLPSQHPGEWWISSWRNKSVVARAVGPKGDGLIGAAASPARDGPPLRGLATFLGNSITQETTWQVWDLQRPIKTLYRFLKGLPVHERVKIVIEGKLAALGTEWATQVFTSLVSLDDAKLGCPWLCLDDYVVVDGGKDEFGNTCYKIWFAPREVLPLTRAAASLGGGWGGSGLREVGAFYSTRGVPERHHPDSLAPELRHGLEDVPERAKGVFEYTGGAALEPTWLYWRSTHAYYAGLLLLGIVSFAEADTVQGLPWARGDRILEHLILLLVEDWPPDRLTAADALYHMAMWRYNHSKVQSYIRLLASESLNIHSQFGTWARKQNNVDWTVSMGYIGPMLLEVALNGASTDTKYNTHNKYLPDSFRARRNVVEHAPQKAVCLANHGIVGSTPELLRINIGNKFLFGSPEVIDQTVNVYDAVRAADDPMLEQFHWRVAPVPLAFETKRHFAGMTVAAVRSSRLASMQMPAPPPPLPQPPSPPHTPPADTADAAALAGTPAPPPPAGGGGGNGGPDSLTRAAQRDQAEAPLPLQPPTAGDAGAGPSQQPAPDQEPPVTPPHAAQATQAAQAAAATAEKKRPFADAGVGHSGLTPDPKAPHHAPPKLLLRFTGDDKVRGESGALCGLPLDPSSHFEEVKDLVTRPASSLRALDERQLALKRCEPLCVLLAAASSAQLNAELQLMHGPVQLDHTLTTIELTLHQGALPPHDLSSALKPLLALLDRCYGGDWRRLPRGASPWMIADFVTLMLLQPLLTNGLEALIIAPEVLVPSQLESDYVEKAAAFVTRVGQGKFVAAMRYASECGSALFHAALRQAGCARTLLRRVIEEYVEIVARAAGKKQQQLAADFSNALYGRLGLVHREGGGVAHSRVFGSAASFPRAWGFATQAEAAAEVAAAVQLLSPFHVSKYADMLKMIE